MGDELASLRLPQVGGERTHALRDASAVFATRRKDGGKTADGGTFKAFGGLDQTRFEGGGSSQLAREEQAAEVSGEGAPYHPGDPAHRPHGASPARHPHAEPPAQRAQLP